MMIMIRACNCNKASKLVGHFLINFLLLCCVNVTVAICVCECVLHAQIFVWPFLEKCMKMVVSCYFVF